MTWETAVAKVLAPVLLAAATAEAMASAACPEAPCWLAWRMASPAADVLPC